MSAPSPTVTKFNPEPDKVYFINQYTLIQILSGHGMIQVDFRNYLDWQDKAIYLEKGQYIKFLSTDFTVRRIEFPSEAMFRNNEVRVLFKHLISLGYINFKECSDCQRYLEQTVFADNASNIIDVSSQQWFWQNPFQASREEYQVIFDLKDVIDEHYANRLTNHDLTALINERGYHAQALIKDRVGLSVKALLTNKRLIESKKDIAFTDKSIKEISHESGYQDPAYFQRVFKAETGQSPGAFRESFDFPGREQFIPHLLELLRTYHTEQRSLGFYADKMNLSVKALSKKVREKLNTSLGQLVRYELIQTAQSMLDEDGRIIDVALRLGFEETNHFSRFFKHYTGLTPSEYQSKKYNA